MLSYHPFFPFATETAHTLILGSFPSLKSFENNFYYAHPSNQFWRLLGDVYSMSTQMLSEKELLLRKQKIGLWDVISSCERQNSADTNLKHSKPNDIEALLKQNPSIMRILFTGKTAKKFFERHFSHLSLPTTLLPSPSSAYASMRYEEKLVRWREILLDIKE